MSWWLLLAAIVITCASFAWRWRRSSGRQLRLMLLCRRAGLDFAPVDLSPGTAWLPFPMFGALEHGTKNVVWDRQRGQEIRAFDFWFEDATDGPRRRLTCAVVPLPASVPRLRVLPRDLAGEVREVLGLPEVRLDLERFDRRFVVEADDERFTIAFLEQRMMEGLLALPEGVTVDVNEDTVLLSAPQLPAEQVLLLFDAAVALERRIPRSLASLYPPRPARGPHEERWLQGRWSPEPTTDAIS